MFFNKKIVASDFDFPALIPAYFSAEKNQTIIVPIPVELVRALMNRNKSPASSYHSAQSTLRAPSADAQLI